MKKGIAFVIAAAAVMACVQNNGTISITPENSLEWMSVYEIAVEDTATVIKGNLYGWEGDKITIPSEVWLKGSASRYRMICSPMPRISSRRTFRIIIEYLFRTCIWNVEPFRTIPVESE